MASKVFAMLAIVLVLAHGHLPPVMGKTAPSDRPKVLARQDIAPGKTFKLEHSRSCYVQSHSTVQTKNMFFHVHVFFP